MRRSFGEDNLLTHIGLLLLRIKTYVLTTAQASDCLATASGFCHFSVGFDQRPIGACLGGWVGSLEMSHERSWLETRFKAKALGERYSLATNVAEVACWGECCDRIPSSRAKNHKTAIRPCCTLRSVLRQDPITPT